MDGYRFSQELNITLVSTSYSPSGDTVCGVFDTRR